MRADECMYKGDNLVTDPQMEEAGVTQMFIMIRKGNVGVENDFRILNTGRKRGD